MNGYPESPGVYKMVKDDEVIYVGQSESISRRLGQHVFVRDEAVQVEYEIIENKQERRKKERKLIKKHQPKLNKQNRRAPSGTQIDFEDAEELVQKTRLSLRQAELYILYVEMGFSVREAADRMGIAAGNASEKWHTVKEKIREAERDKTAGLELP